MAKKANPIITHTEILNRAIKSIEAEIDEWSGRCKGLPKEQAENYFNATTKDLREKLETLKTLYRIETGTDFI